MEDEFRDLIEEEELKNARILAYSYALYESLSNLKAMGIVLILDGLLSAWYYKKQSFYEHIPRFGRAMMGMTLLLF